MPKEKTEVMCVLADALPQFPKGIQGYVNRYFEKTTFLGHVYFTASLATSYDSSKNRDVKGVAPKFPENYCHFSEGLAGLSPYSWFQKKLEDTVQQEIVCISHAWEPDCAKEDND